MFKDLFEKVRMQGRIQIRNEASVRDFLPVIYTGESSEQNSDTVNYLKGMNYHLLS